MEDSVASRSPASPRTAARDGDILVFDPTHVPDGIVLLHDPILLARPGGRYRVSVTRRTATG